MLLKLEKFVWRFLCYINCYATSFGDFYATLTENFCLAINWKLLFGKTYLVDNKLFSIFQL